jgi:hypothetical protein
MSKLTIPISVNLGSSLAKFKSIEDKLLALLGAYDKNEAGLKEFTDSLEDLSKVEIGENIADSLQEIAPAADSVGSALEEVKEGILNFVAGTQKIEDVIPAFAELVQQAGGIDEAFEALKDLPFFDDFKKGLEDGLDLIDQFGSQAIDVNFKPINVNKELSEAKLELRALILEFGKFSPQADAAAKKVKELQSVIEDAGAATKASDFEGQFQLFGRAVQGVAGGFQAVLGVQALFGKQSKQTEEALKKVQAAMALTQGIDSVLQGVKAFKAIGAQIANAGILTKIYSAGQVAAAAVTRLFGAAVNTTSVAFKGLATAIAATGIGALIVGLGLLVAYWDDVKEALSGTTQAQRDYNKVKEANAEINKKGIEGAAEEISKLKTLYTITQDQTVSLKTRNKAVDELQKLYPSYFGNLKNEAILAGNAKGAYDDLSKSIIAKAKAQAGQDKITELFKDEDYQKALKRVEGVNIQIERIRKQGVSSAERIAFKLPSIDLGPESASAQARIRQLQESVKDFQGTIDQVENQATGIIRTFGAGNIVDAIIGDPKKVKEELTPLESVFKKLKDSLKQIEADVKIGVETKPAESQLKVFQTAAAELLQLGIKVDSPKLKPILEQIGKLKLQVITAEIDTKKLSEEQQKIIEITKKFEADRKELIAGGVKDFEKFEIAKQEAVNKVIKEFQKKRLDEILKNIIEESKVRAAASEKQAAQVKGTRDLIFRAELSAIKNEKQRRFKEIQKSENDEQSELEKQYANKEFGLTVFLKRQAAIEEFYRNERASAEEKAREEELKKIKESQAIVADAIAGAADAFGEALVSGADPFQAVFKSLANSLGSYLQKLGKEAILTSKLILKIKALIGTPAGIVTGIALVALGAAIKAAFNKKTEKGFATGGFVSGPGSGTSDSIPARLSNGEYVINSKTVGKFGKGFFDGLNFGNVLKFQEGGFVGTPQISTSLNLGTPQTANETFSREVPYVASTKVSGQDLKIILERADKRFSNAT